MNYSYYIEIRKKCTNFYTYGNTYVVCVLQLETEYSEKIYLGVITYYYFHNCFIELLGLQSLPHPQFQTLFTPINVYYHLSIFQFCIHNVLCCRVEPNKKGMIISNDLARF